MPRAEAKWVAPRRRCCDQECTYHHGTYAWPQEISLQALKRRLAPGEQRTDSGKQKKEKRNWNTDLIKKRWPDCDLVSLDPFGEHGKQGSPEHGEAGQQQKKIIEQEAGFARDQRFQPVLAAQMRTVLPVKVNAGSENYCEESHEPVADR